jgi:hypothetical protein
MSGVHRKTLPRRGGWKPLSVKIINPALMRGSAGMAGEAQQRAVREAVIFLRGSGNHCSRRLCAAIEP